MMYFSDGTWIGHVRLQFWLTASLVLMFHLLHLPAPWSLDDLNAQVISLYQSLSTSLHHTFLLQFFNIPFLFHLQKLPLPWSNCFTFLFHFLSTLHTADLKAVLSKSLGICSNVCFLETNHGTTLQYTNFVLSTHPHYGHWQTWCKIQCGSLRLKFPFLNDDSILCGLSSPKCWKTSPWHVIIKQEILWRSYDAYFPSTASVNAMMKRHYNTHNSVIHFCV